MTTQAHLLGARGEAFAQQYYRHRGYTIVETNVSYPCGEIDIIASEVPGTVVFIEVKTRRWANYGGAEAVTATKLSRLRQAASRWLREQEAYFPEVRFDVIVLTPASESVARPVDQTDKEFSVELYEGVENGSC